MKNEPNQPEPNLTQVLILRANPTQLNPILDHEGATQPKNGLSRVQIWFIKFIELKFEVKPDTIGPFFGSWGPTQPVWTRKLGPKLGWTRKNRSGVAPLVSNI